MIQRSIKRLCLRALIVDDELTAETAEGRATRALVHELKQRGVEFIGPEEGMLACGYEGVGRLWKVDEIAFGAEFLLVPMVAFLFHEPLFGRPLLLAVLLVLGTLGFAAVGTLFAAMLLRSRSRDVILPILLYPITIPVIIAGVRGTSAVLASPPDTPTTIMWLAILACFDVVFVTLSLWTFEPLMTE